MPEILDVLLHLDIYLQVVVEQYAVLAYVFLFFIIFLETGLVVMPFLPGDSLLFAAGALAAGGWFRLEFLFPLLFVAGVLGDTINYHIGKFAGPKIFKRESSFFFHKEHLIRAQKFFEERGKKTIILARFIPLMRTFIPFVAGIGAMSYRIFLKYNILGAFLWCFIFIFGGFLFGNIPWIKERFGLLILGIIFISCIPFIREIIFHCTQKLSNKR